MWLSPAAFPAGQMVEVPMKVLVCGSRDWADPMAVTERIVDLAEAYPAALVIHGGCRGADMRVEGAAIVCNLRTKVFLADWRRFGRKAGPLRNRQMLDEEPDLVIAFQRDGSRGTQDTIDEARRRGIPVEVHIA
jgi:hypothetical protein